MKSKVYIFTEGGDKSGYGHLTRCISLYDEFQKKGYRSKFIVNGDKRVEKFLDDRDHIIKDWRDEEYIEELLNTDDYVIIDSYKTSRKLYKKISENSKKALYIDDDNRLKYPKGVVLNPSIHGHNLNYPDREEIRYISGEKYILLRKDFIDISDREYNKEIKKVMVIFGGSDIKNLTPKTLKILKENYPNVQKDIVIGSGYNNEEEIKKGADENTYLHYGLNGKEMKELMMESDLAITGAGQTIYELLRVKTPFLPIQVAENQKNNIKFLENLGIIRENIKEEELEGKIKNYFKNYRSKLNIHRAIDTIDGEGGKRVVEFFLQDYDLRKAKPEDIDDIFNLSNQDYVRKYSINTKKIAWVEHKKWFNKALKDPNIIFYIVENSKGDFLGQVRFKKEGDSATVSLSFSKKLKGKGFSKPIMKDALEKVREEKNIANAKAVISKKNAISLKLFRGLGFRIVDENDNFYIYNYNL